MSCSWHFPLSRWNSNGFNRQFAGKVFNSIIIGVVFAIMLMCVCSIRWHHCSCWMLYDYKQSSSSLRLARKFCSALIPIVAIIDALIFAVSGCFDCENWNRRRKPRFGCGEIARLSEESRCKVIRCVCVFFFPFWTIFFVERFALLISFGLIDAAHDKVPGVASRRLFWNLLILETIS